jgi:urea transport system substrate-binding protein
METEFLVGHLAAWNYFQSVPGAENRAFVKAFKKYATDNNLPGGMKRVTDDPILWAYTGVYLWAAAVEKAGSFEVEEARPALYGLSFDSPGGTVMMDARNHHLHKPVYIGEIKKNGQFKIVYQSDGLVAPDPWDDITSADKDCDHVDHMGTYTMK